MNSSKYLISLQCIALLFAIQMTACESDSSNEPPRAQHAYVITQVPNRNGIIFSGGDFRNAKNQSGNKLLGHNLMVILDAKNPAHPLFISERDMKLTQVFSIIGDKLIGVQHGFDEEKLGTSGALPQQNIRIKIYGLTDPLNPQLEKSFALPDTAGRSFTSNFQVSENQIIFSTGTGGELEDGTSYTWLVNPTANPGEEIVASSSVACRAPILDGSKLWCVNGLGKGTGFVAAFDLDSSKHTLTEAFRAALPELILPIEASLIGKWSGDTGVSYRVAVADLNAGLIVFDLKPNGSLTSLKPLKNFEGSPAAVLTTTKGYLLTQTSGGFYLLDASGNPLQNPIEISKLIHPGVLYSNYGGGNGIKSFGPEKNNQFAAALGDYGVLLIKISEYNQLEKIGGYYRHWGTNWATSDQLQEGNY